jgi:hypothetical protein
MLQAVGTSAAAARHAVLQLAQAALAYGDDGIDPLLLEARGQRLLVYRTPAGWMYTSLSPAADADGQVRRTSTVMGHQETRAQVERAARLHLAQSIYQEQVFSSEDPAPLPDGFEVLKDDASRAAFARWVGFQRAYREAESMVRMGCLEAGLEHDWACRHDQNFAPDWAMAAAPAPAAVEQAHD